MLPCTAHREVLQANPALISVLLKEPDLINEQIKAISRRGEWKKGKKTATKKSFFNKSAWAFQSLQILQDLPTSLGLALPQVGVS